ncbi:MAG: alanine--tRNA ligase [Chthoniobacteraceae bacterium]|nr:alanine--tRNA ligase [Chthoniobacteraceae bacterium]
MTSSEIRQSFLDFFHEKEHTIVPSASLLPSSPNLLFTNAGMNQFVPIFLGEAAADVNQWPGAVSGCATRACDTQKCIRAGGKHNDLDDVGLDTYHHTFFEMLGNWSFGDYFKHEAIAWAWELVVVRWKFPAERLYATVYCPDKSKGDPADFDTEAYEAWARLFESAGLDPKVHIVNGNKKDNFWMMGETGPCGPCSELHMDLTPKGDTKGSLVNMGSPRCIEIWNLVFIQFNANQDGTFSPLPAKHVDTGMGFERVASIVQGSKNFTDFEHAKISNYETDIFRPIFDELEKMSGLKYGCTLPVSGSTGDTEEEKIDVAFRVIADHIRTLSFAIADGIQPGNTDRNYVLRRILRRAVKYGRTLGFQKPFFYQLADVLVRTMGGVFPEIRAKSAHVKEVLLREEEAFNRTLDKGIALFESETAALEGKRISGAFAFRLYDEQGFPLDLTELLARERGLGVDVAGFNALMDEQRERARKAQKREIISVSHIEAAPTQFIGYDSLTTPATVLDVVDVKGKTAVILDVSPCYAEMGGQVGDMGEMEGAGQLWHIAGTQKTGATWLHFLAESDAPAAGTRVTLTVDIARRAAIARHHTVTHLLHWALHRVVSAEIAQKGSFVGPDKLTFDFNSGALTPEQVHEVERLVNARIVENAPVSWTEVPYADIRANAGIRQIFGDKYGDMVRVVQIGGEPHGLDGYSMELCGGTHVRATGEIGLFRIVSEAAVAAGVRRIEAVAGLAAYDQARETSDRIAGLASKLNAPLGELERKLDALLTEQKELHKQLKAVQHRQAAQTAQTLLAKAETLNGTPAIVANLGDADGDTLQAVADALKGHFQGVAVLAGAAEGRVALAASVSPEFVKAFQAGKLIQALAPLVGGKGGGRPDFARGAGKEPGQIDAALAKARALLGA